MQDARTPSSRLEGLIPKVEDFNNQAEWMKLNYFNLWWPFFIKLTHIFGAEVQFCNAWQKY